jgi:hypothetical protein
LFLLRYGSQRELRNFYGSGTYYGQVSFRGGSIQSAVETLFTPIAGFISIDFDNVPRLNSSGQPIGFLQGLTTGVRTLAYGPLVAADNFVGRAYIPVGNTTAFTINAPTFPFKGQTITYDIKNNSGGAMGAITWAAAFLLGGAFTNPANGKRRTISFYYDGASWIETNRATADI